MPIVLPFKSKQERDKDLARLIATTAYEGFIATGRGALIYEAMPFKSGYRLRFVESGSPEFESILGEDLPEFARMIASYEPEIEFICVYLDEEGFEIVRYRINNRRTLRKEWEQKRKK
jgi:hypothetical protein